jgi:hypothetical protein
VQKVLPGQGRRVVLPLPGGLNDWNASLSARLGAPGTYVAYADGKAAHLYRYGGRSVALRRGPFTSAAVCAAPAGRLWMAWGDKADGLFATRSNMAATGFEAVQRLKLPQNTTDGLTYVECEGSLGPVDLFADAVIGSAGGFWHSHLLAHFALQARPSRSGVALVTRDAGDPVAGATIKIGSKTVQTNASGQAAVALRRGTYSATATAPSYASTSVHFRIR